MKINCKAILPVFLLTISLSSPLLASQGSLSKPLVLVNSNWSPYKGEELPRGGVVTDITKRALERAGYEVAVVNAPWKRALKGAYDGVYDVIPAIWKTPERAEKLAFGAAVLTSRIVIISQAIDNFKFDSLDDLKGRSVGVGAGWAYPDAFEKAKGIKKDEALNLDTNLKKLVVGRVQHVIGEEVASRYTANKLFETGSGLLDFSEKALQEKHLHVAFSQKLPKHSEVMRRFNAAIAEMKIDGTYRDILSFHGIPNVTVPE